MTAEINYLTQLSCIDPQVSPMFSSLFWKWFQHVVVSWDFLAAQVLVVYQADCSSGQQSLTGLRFVSCPAFGMEMHE